MKTPIPLGVSLLLQQEHWTARRIVITTLTVLGVGLAFWLFYRFYVVVFCLLVAMKPLVEALYQRGLSRQFGVVLVYTGLLVALIGGMLLLTPVLVEQINAISVKLPSYYQTVRSALQSSGSDFIRTMSYSLPVQLTPAALQPSADPDSVEAVVRAWSTIGSGLKAVVLAISVFMMAFYVTLERDRIMYAMLLRFRLDRRAEIRQLMADIETKVGKFYRGQLILCTFVGVISTLAYTLMGLPYVGVLGLLAFVFDAVPILGTTLIAGSGILVALATAPDKIIWVIVVTIAIDQIENSVLVPRAMDKTVGVKATVAILSIAALGLLFGIAGALLAIPVAAILQVLLNHFLFEESAALSETEPVDFRDDQPLLERNYLSALRLEAQEIAQDVRKRLRNADSTAGLEEEHLEDMIETMASDLDSYLTQVNATLSAKQEPAPLSLGETAPSGARS